MPPTAHRIAELRSTIERLQHELSDLLEGEPVLCVHCWCECPPSDIDAEGECSGCRDSYEDPNAEHREAHVADCIGGCRE